MQSGAGSRSDAGADAGSHRHLVEVDMRRIDTRRSQHVLNPQGRGTNSFQKQHTDKRQHDRRQEDNRVFNHLTEWVMVSIKRSHDGAPP